MWPSTPAQFFNVLICALLSTPMLQLQAMRVPNNLDFEAAELYRLFSHETGEFADAAKDPYVAGLKMGAKDPYVRLRIGAFNIQIFGEKKMTNNVVVGILVKILLRYDIVLIQEIRSVTTTPINALLAAVNGMASPTGGVYAMALSRRLGRSDSKEQYAYFYRTDKVTLLDSYVYEDSKKDAFQREPFIVKFKAPNSYIKEFAVVGIHTMPTKAVSEIDHLVDVYDDIGRRLHTSDVIIMGDFNGDCSYVTKRAWKKIRLATDRRFYWLFDNSEDTTVSGTDCAYDRMVVAGNVMRKAILPGSAAVFNFEQFYHLTRKEAKLVSDHWVIEVTLKDQSFKDEENYIQEPRFIAIEDERLTGIPKKYIYPLSRKKNPLLKKGFSVKCEYTKGRRIENLILEKNVESIEKAVEATQALQAVFPRLLTKTQVEVSQRRMEEFLTELQSSCLKASRAGAGQIYQVLPEVSCSGKNERVNKAKLVCSLSKGSCKILFVFN